VATISTLTLRMKKTLGLYAGSFDPFTRGHFDIVQQASRLFDVIEIAIGQNVKKKRLFDFEESAHLIRESLAAELMDSKRFRIVPFHGSLMRHAKSEAATAVIRGLRQVSDFNDEFVLHGVLERSMDIPVVYLICRQEFLHVSSSTARELASLGEPTNWLVHSSVEKALRDKFPNELLT
jgi:pantetheine-phosphate adenylyltransferase